MLMSAFHPKRTWRVRDHMKSVMRICALAFALLGCSNARVPPGYSVRLLADSAHHPPAKFHLAIDPTGDALGSPPVEESVLSDWWQAAAQEKCGSRRVIVSYGPELVKALPEYCGGRSHCPASVNGYFHCSRKP